jgi:hypothetical protein
METPAYPITWTDRVGKFADAVGIPIEKITEALKSVVGDPGDEALILLSEPSATPDADIKEALKEHKIPSGKLNMHLAKLRGDKPAVSADSTDKAAAPVLSILPNLPDETSFIEMLKVGGDLKVGKTEVLSAVKAALAKQVGLYELPGALLKKMEEFSEEQEEPCGKEFFEVQKLLTEKKYGDILAVIGVTGSFISEGRKNAFLAKLDEYLWESLKSFHLQLNAWQKTWMEGAANPAIMMMALAKPGGALPPGIADPPDVSPVRVSGEEVINKINKVFAGPGIPVARAMAYDATRILGIIENPKILTQTGYTTKDQMLKGLGVAVGSEIVRMEQNITRYTLAIMSLPEVAADDELMYLTAMLRLDGAIPWDKLGAKGIGSKRDLR